MEGNRGNEGNPNALGIPEVTSDQSRQASENLLSNYSSVSSQGQSAVDGLTESVLSQLGISQTPLNRPIYAVSQKGNNASRNVTPPSLPSSPPPSTLNSEGEYMYMNKNYGRRRSVSSEASNDFQQCSSNGLSGLSSDSISESEMSEAVDQAAKVVSSPEAQKQLKNKIENDPSFVKEQLTKFNKLSNKDKSLFGLSTFGIAIGAPLAIVALPILATVAAVAGLAIAIIGGLKLATPSKAEFRKTGQKIMHDVKNAANVLPRETNLEKLWKSTHKPGVTSKNPNLEEFLTKYCFPDQESGKKAEVKFDPDKIEALKYAAKEVGLDLDIDRMVRKGESKVSGDYVQGKSSQAQDNKFIATASEIATAVMEKHRLPDSKNVFTGIQGIFESKLTEIKQAKEEKAAEKKNSFSSMLQRSSSHTESVEAGRKESNNGLSKG
ncbi:hypothetical protein [Candidatus Mesenet endosymbiont of Agriotes lineatus]|uniref:hypothetical protein n=1 Tax=Candidatus Mesenet endosymbiont of Agriotes lineatus TaxID=3077948 RepID=UPI0030D5F79F